MKKASLSHSARGGRHFLCGLAPVFEIAQADAKLWNVKRMPAAAERVRSRAKHGAAQIRLCNYPSSMVDVAGEDGEQCFHDPYVIKPLLLLNSTLS